MQINVRVQEPGVGVLFHQAVDFHLCSFKTAPVGMCHVLLDGTFGVVVNVDLSERTLGHNEKPFRITVTDMANQVHILNLYLKGALYSVL